jgi:uncharacterized membrane protein
MIRFSSEATIARPIEDVYAYLVDINRYGEWMPVDNVRMLSGRSDLVGSTLALNMPGPTGRRYEMEFEIAEASPRRVVWRVIRGAPIRGHYRVELEPIDGTHTRVVYAGELSLTGLWRLLTPILAREIQSGEAKELGRLWQNLESASVEMAPATA